MAIEKITTNRPRKIVLWFLISVMVLLGGIYLLRDILIAPYAIAFLERTAAANLGLQISIGQLGGSYVSNLEIKNVTTVKRAVDGLLTEVQVRRLRLAYHLWDLFDGLPAFMAASTIELDGARLSVQPTGEPQTGKDPSAAPGVRLPPGLPRIHIQDSFIQIDGIGYQTSFEGISLTTGPTQSKASRLRLQVDRWSLEHPALRGIAAALQTDIVYSGGSLKIEKLLVDQKLLVISAGIGLLGLPQDIPFELRLRPAGGQLDVDGRVAANRLQVDVSGSNLDLGFLSTLLAPQTVPFGGRLALQGRLVLPFSDPEDMVGDLKIQLKNGSVNHIASEQLAFRITAGGGLMDVADLQLTTGANRLNVSRASIAADLLYGADLDAILQSLTVDWQLEASDVPAALGLFGLGVAGHEDRIPAHSLILNGRMEDGDLLIPEGRLDAEGGHIHLKAARIALPIGGRNLGDSPLAGDLSLDLPDTAVLSRIFALPALGGTVRGQIKVSGSLRSPQGAAEISGKRLTYREGVLGNLMIRARGDIRGIVVESAVLERDRDRASGQGTIKLADKAFEAVRVGLSVSDLEPYFSDLLPLFRPQPQKAIDVLGSLQASVRLDGPFAKPAGSLNLQARQIRIQDTSIGDADVDLKFADDKLLVTSAEFRNRNDRLDLSGSIRLQQKLLEDVKVNLAISDLAAYQAPWLPALTGVSGSLQVELNATGEVTLPEGAARLQVKNIQFKELHLGNLNAEISSSGRLLRIESAEASMDQKRMQVAGTIRRSPTDTEFDITLGKLAIIRRDKTLLTLERDATFRLFRNGRMDFGNLDLAGSAGRVAVEGRFDPEGSTHLLIRTGGLTGDGWLDLLVADRLQFQGLDARIQVAGKSTAPSFTAEGSLDNLGSPGVPMAFSGRFNLEYDRKEVKFRQFEWEGQKGQRIELAGTLPLDLYGKNRLAPGPIALTGRSRISDAGVLEFIFPWTGSTGGSIQCDLELGGTWKNPSGRLQLAVDDLKRPVDIRPLPPGPYRLNSDIRVDGDLVTLASLAMSSGGWNIEANGQWRGAPALSELISPATRKLSGQISLDGSLAVSDLGWIPAEVEGVRRLTGRLEARGTLQGPISAPRAEATVKLSNAEFAPDFDMASLRGLNLEAAVTPQAVNVRSFTGELGGAPFELTGAWKLAAGGGPAADLKLRGQNLLLFRNENLRLRSDTDLTLKGPLARLELAGEVALTDGRFSKNFGVIEGFAAAGKPDSGGESGFQLFSIRNPPLRDMVFDVRITARKPFVVRNNLVRGAARPDLLLAGSGEVPLLTGTVYVETTRLYLPAGRLDLERGIVRFDRADPDRPRLDMIGSATMLGYDITAVIDGPYDEPTITLSSIPPLPNDELLMLLLTGQPPKSSGAQSDANRQGLNIAVFLGRDLIGRWSDDGSGEALESILDRFDVEVGRGITQQGEDTIHSRFRVADDILVEGDSLYLTGERDVFDYYNGGIKFVLRFR